jgi:flagellar FliJ protein
MRRFRFKLQAVLDQRKAREDRLLAELGELRREESAEVARLAMLTGQLEQSCEAMSEAYARSAPANELALRDEHLEALRDDVRLQELTLQTVRERVEAKRQEVVEAVKDRRLIETLRDKQEQTYVLEMARAEQRMLDDMASVRYARSG